MPTAHVEAELQQNPIRYKNLLQEAERLLGERDTEHDADAVLKTARAKLNDTEFWRHNTHGLAVFITPDETRFYRLPLDFEELCIVGHQFHLKPLFPLIASNNRFFVLALSQNQVQLFQGTHYSINEVDARELPKSLQEALFYDDPEQSVQWHTGNRAGNRQDAMFHGQGVQEEDKRHQPHDSLIRFFREVDEGVRDALQDETAPLILAGVQYYLPLYRKVNRYKHLVEDEMVTGNPDGRSAKQLHEKAWAIVEKRLQAAQDEALEAFRAADARGELASTDLKEIIPASVFGRVGTLFVPVYKHVWGSYDPDANAVAIHDERQPDDIDLLNLAAVHVYLNGGQVHALRPDNMPTTNHLAAQFRYPADVEAHEMA